ncbi:hypothetical protein B0T26DRAFT_681683 [Lasiosphaeria miniovina]|uniref:GPI inositol-deacylase n=1 Tax=Lasiosphaeria miniovina TaxID=1954250 RepID=A0AA40DKF3_9PEZI|nr:uncharacterized protein B0T26DRAFT_681683 [Lasiosphaeria miniovina]KAK0704077.1 hypothetical protein B0T26DRAFT_681683 [Lasiosphaeria miniovina]
MATKPIKEGVDIVLDPPDATVDILAIPGLGANPAKSWMWNEKEENSFNWLSSSDGLKKDFPKARVLLYYYASAYRGSFKIKQYMTNIAKVMLDALQLRREARKCPRRPIVLIGHSMGGLVAAKVLLLAEQRRDIYPDMYESIVACLTFGTPFDGAPVADIATEWTKINEALGTAISSKLLDLLTPGNESLRELKHEFVRSAGKLGQKVEIHCFYEELQTHWEPIISKLASTDFPSQSLSKLKLKEYRDFVSRDSATLPGVLETGLARTHRDLVRFEGFKDTQYQLVRAPLKRIINSAPLNAKARFNFTRQSTIDSATLASVINALEGADIQKKFRALSQRLASESWIVKEPEYLDWLQSEGRRDQYLWIYGPEGKGKTTAVTAVIREIESRISEDELNRADQFPTLLAYFFCDQAPDYCTAEDVVKSLLLQLCKQQDVLATYAKQFTGKSKTATKSSAKDEPKDGANAEDGPGASKTKDEAGGKSKGDSSALGIENLWQSLKDMLTEGSIGTVYFVICNLHELPEEDDSTRKLLSFIQAAIQEGGSAAVESSSGKRVRTKWLFASRDRLSIRRVLGASPPVRGIDLDDAKYGDKVKLELQRHAWAKVDDLQRQKGYNKAMAYFAGSVIGSRAESTKWIDVAIVQLAALPAKANDIRVRRMLERVPQDFAALLDNAWIAILKPTDDDMDTIKELLRALVLAYQDPTESELLVLAGLSSEDAGAKESLRKMIDKCRPLLTLRKSGDEAEISFVNADVKKHLHRNSKKLLGLEEDAIKLQHGILALRCFSHVVDRLTAALQNTSKEEQPQPAETRPAKDAADDAAEPAAKDSGDGGDDDADSGSDSDDFDEEFDEEFDSDSDSDSDDHLPNHANDAPEPGSGKQQQQQPPPLLALRYATKYWLRHASEATLDIAQRLSLEKTFWDADSKIRRLWLAEYERLTGAFEDFDVDSLKALHVAAAIGFPHLVETLIKAGYEHEVREYDSLSNSPLHLAASFGKTEIVEQLLMKGAAIDDAGEDGTSCTPLSMAALSGCTAVMAKLMSWKANPDAVDAEMGPVVNAAILSGNTDAAKMLIDKGARLNYDDDDGSDDENEREWSPPLALAAEYSDLTMFDTILEAGAQSLGGDEYDKALVAAAVSGRVEVVGRLLQFNPSEASFQDALEAAHAESNWDVAKVLLRSAPQPLDCDDLFETAATDAESLESVLQAVWEHTHHGVAQPLLDECLYAAADSEKEDTVKALLAMGASPDAPGDEYGNALTAAANDGTSAIVAALLSAGAAVTSSAGFALQAAAAQGHGEVVAQLLDAGAQIDHVSPHHSSGTALQAACDYGYAEIVSLLISRGADVNLGSGENELPVLAATMQAEPEILKLLLQAPGIEVNPPDSGPRRASPLHHAASLLPEESVRALLAAGARVDVADADGATPLMAAAASGDDECVRVLLEYGADVMVVSPHLGTALEVAAAEGSEECVSLLLARALVVLRELKKAADAGGGAARRIIEAERTGRKEAMAAEAKKRAEEEGENASVSGAAREDSHHDEEDREGERQGSKDIAADGEGDVDGELIAGMESLHVDNQPEEGSQAGDVPAEEPNSREVADAPLDLPFQGYEGDEGELPFTGDLPFGNDSNSEAGDEYPDEDSSESGPGKQDSDDEGGYYDSD